MSNLQFTLIKTEEGTSVVTVFVPGHKPEVADSSHPNFDAIQAGVLADDPNVINLFDVAETAGSKFEALSDRVSAKNGRLYLDGDEINNALSEQVLRFLEEGVEDWVPLVNFFENVQANPNEHSREQLYAWLDAEAFTITYFGDIVGYKGVTTDGDGEYVSIHSGKAIVDGEVVEGRIPNPLGSVIEMPRSEVHHAPGVGCSTGLHVGTWDYASDFARGAVLEVHVNPRDVVSVPTDSGCAKMRVCRYVVVNVIDQAYSQAVVGSQPEDGLDEDVFDWGDGEGEGDDVVDTSVKPGDRFRSTDSRRRNSFVVEEVTWYDAWVKSEQTGVHRSIALDRLNSYRYERI